MSIADMSWTIWFYRTDADGARVLIGLVEDAELVAKLKLLAEELQLRVEISELSNTPLSELAPTSNPLVSDPSPALNFPESWRRKKPKTEK